MTTIDAIRAIERDQTLPRIEYRPIDAERIWEIAAAVLFGVTVILALIIF